MLIALLVHHYLYRLQATLPPRPLAKVVIPNCPKLCKQGKTEVEAKAAVSGASCFSHTLCDLLAMLNIIIIIIIIPVALTLVCILSPPIRIFAQAHRHSLRHSDIPEVTAVALGQGKYARSHTKTTRAAMAGAVQQPSGHQFARVVTRI